MPAQAGREDDQDGCKEKFSGVHFNCSNAVVMFYTNDSRIDAFRGDHHGFESPLSVYIPLEINLCTGCARG